MNMTTKIAIIPGNGGGDVECCNWYPWVRDKLNNIPGVHAILRNMPDPELAREAFWIPFMHTELHCDEDTIIIGHSSGAVAAMRYAGKYKVKGIILISGYVTDLGDDCERASGYFDRPWEWEKIRSNCGIIVQFGSTDDPFVPWAEQKQICEGLSPDLHQYSDQGHFLNFQFPDLIKCVKQYLIV